MGEETTFDARVGDHIYVNTGFHHTKHGFLHCEFQPKVCEKLLSEPAVLLCGGIVIEESRLRDESLTEILEGQLHKLPCYR